MFKPEIKEKIREKYEYDFYILKEYITIYLKLFLFLKDTKELRSKFTSFIKNYYLYSLLEYQLLFKIKNIKYQENLETICIDLLDKMDSIFFKLFHYNEYILSGYEDAITCNDSKRAIIVKREFEVLSQDDKNEFIKKLNLSK